MDRVLLENVEPCVKKSESALLSSGTPGWYLVGSPKQMPCLKILSPIRAAVPETGSSAPGSSPLSRTTRYTTPACPRVSTRAPYYRSACGSGTLAHYHPARGPRKRAPDYRSPPGPRKRAPDYRSSVES